jgi:hypothetical protein
MQLRGSWQNILFHVFLRTKNVSAIHTQAIVRYYDVSELLHCFRHALARGGRACKNILLKQIILLDCY